MASTKYGSPVGPAGDRLPVARASVPYGLTFTQVSGGSLDVTAAVDGSDTQDTLTVGGTNILGSAVTWATSDDVFGRAIAAAINANNHSDGKSGYWATYDTGGATADKVEIWPLTAQTANNTDTVTGTATSWSPTYEDMGTFQAYAAAVMKGSYNQGQDIFADATTMWQVNIDFSYLQGLDTAWDLTTAKAVELIIRPEDQIVNVYYGGGDGYFPAASAENTYIDMLAVAEGHLSLFMQAQAATNLGYMIRIY